MTDLPATTGNPAPVMPFSPASTNETRLCRICWEWHPVTMTECPDEDTPLETRLPDHK